MMSGRCREPLAPGDQRFGLEPRRIEIHAGAIVARFPGRHADLFRAIMRRPPEIEALWKPRAMSDPLLGVLRPGRSVQDSFGHFIGTIHVYMI